MTSPETPFVVMASSKVPFEMVVSSFETMWALSMTKLCDAMIVEMSEVVLARITETVLPEMMTPAVFKMSVTLRSVFIVAPVEIRGIIIRIIPIGGAGDLDIVAAISEISMTTFEARCVFKYFFGPFYRLFRFTVGFLQLFFDRLLFDGNQGLFFGNLLQFKLLPFPSFSFHSFFNGLIIGSIISRFNHQYSLFWRISIGIMLDSVFIRPGVNIRI
jgi:hypothetical protein